MDDSNLDISENKETILFLDLCHIIVNIDEYSGTITQIANFLEKECKLENRQPMVSMNLLRKMMRIGLAYKNGVRNYRGKTYDTITFDRKKIINYLSNFKTFQRSSLITADMSSTIDPFPLDKETRHKLYNEINLKEDWRGKITPIKQKLK